MSRASTQKAQRKKGGNKGESKGKLEWFLQVTRHPFYLKESSGLPGSKRVCKFQDKDPQSGSGVRRHKMHPFAGKHHHRAFLQRRGQQLSHSPRFHLTADCDARVSEAEFATGTVGRILVSGIEYVQDAGDRPMMAVRHAVIAFLVKACPTVVDYRGGGPVCLLEQSDRPGMNEFGFGPGPAVDPSDFPSAAAVEVVITELRVFAQLENTALERGVVMIDVGKAGNPNRRLIKRMQRLLIRPDAKLAYADLIEILRHDRKSGTGTMTSSSPPPAGSQLQAYSTRRAQEMRAGMARLQTVTCRPQRNTEKDYTF